MNNFTKFYDKLTLTIEFPDILARLQGSDTNIELITSSTIMKLRMSIKSSPVTISNAFIFVTPFITSPDLEPLVYSDCNKRAQKTQELFQDML